MLNGRRFPGCSLGLGQDDSISSVQVVIPRWTSDILFACGGERPPGMFAERWPRG
jgi:hypothetical protein